LPLGFFGRLSVMMTRFGTLMRHLGPAMRDHPFAVERMAAMLDAIDAEMHGDF
jgi:hypothetical protein